MTREERIASGKVFQAEIEKMQLQVNNLLDAKRMLEEQRNKILFNHELGDRVTYRGKPYEITRFASTIYVYGKHVKKDGTLGKQEHTLFLEHDLRERDLRGDD